MTNTWKQFTKTSIRKHTLVFSFCAAMLASVFAPQSALANGESAANLTQLKQSIAADMTNRETTFTVRYTGEKPEKAEVSKTFKQAIAADDYLRLSWTKADYSIVSYNGYSDIKFTVKYHTTKEQEDYIDSQAKKITGELIQAGMNDMEKVTAIHKWIVGNVSYDYTITDVTAYTALTKGKTVCMGYSILMKKMLSYAGVEAKVVTGNIPQGYHAWNMVKVDGNWYYVDATAAWGAQAKLPKFRTSEQLSGESYVWDSAALPQTGSQMF